MASEIKIHLATYLKDAGIKATRQQIDKLAQDVKKANKDIASGALESAGSLGRLEGPFGKLGGALGKFGGISTAVIAAFKTGWDIGSWLNSNVIWPLLGIKDPIEQLKKENAELEKQAQKAFEAYNSALTEWEKGWEKQVAGADKARKAVEEATAAYLHMEKARAAVASVADDTATLGLRRDKFNAMAGAATPEEAAAAGKYYDILLAEEQQKRKLAEFDREATIEAERQLGAEEALRKARDKRAALNRQMVELERKLAPFNQARGQGVAGMNFAGDEKTEQRLLEQKAKLQEKLDAANADVKKRKDELAAAAVESSANEQRRANIQESAQLEIDEKKKAYDDYIAYVEQQEQQRLADEWQQQQEQIEKEQQERTRMEQQLAAQRIEDLRAEMRERQQAEAEARSRSANADSKLAQAWSWYKNKDGLRAQIKNEETDIAAQQQYQKDFRSLTHGRWADKFDEAKRLQAAGNTDELEQQMASWRKGPFGLDVDTEATMRVALAADEQTNARNAMIETAENTRRLSEKLDELLQIKG